MVSEPVGPNPLVWEPPRSASSASVEPIGSKVSYRSQWRTWWCWMLRGGKATHQLIDDDDGRRGKVLNLRREEEHGLEVKEAVRNLAAR